MSQDNLIKLQCEGDENGKGKGDILRTHKNKKKFANIRLRLKKFNKRVGKHLWYKETK